MVQGLYSLIEEIDVKCLVRRFHLGETINGVTYEGVAEFIYLGTLISNDDNV